MVNFESRLHLGPNITYISYHSLLGLLLSDDLVVLFTEWEYWCAPSSSSVWKRLLHTWQRYVSSDCDSCTFVCFKNSSNSLNVLSQLLIIHLYTCQNTPYAIYLQETSSRLVRNVYSCTFARNLWRVEPAPL